MADTADDVTRCPSCGGHLDPDDHFCSKCGASLPSMPTVAAAELEPDGAEHTDPELEKSLRAALSPNYLLIRQIGVGGMGSVFLAREPALKRLVAVKVLAGELAADQSARARFQREAEAVAGISHPNVVSIYGLGELEDGTPYFVMQYVSGRSMAARLGEEGELGVEEVKHILGEVASALAAAHKRGVIHRDIKPANILYDEESGRVLVSDFGIAAVRPGGDSEDKTQLTRTGMAIGTPKYMSPEQLLAEKVTDRTDVYAVGLTGYELLTGRGPFDIKSPQEIMAAHLRDEPVKLSRLRSDIDPEFESLLAACLSKKATERPAAAEVAKRLLPGAGALLEWPPPGLEALRGKGVTLALLWLLASSLFAVSALVLVGIGPSLSSAVTSFAALLPLIFGTVGVVALAVAVSSTWRLSRRVGRAFDLGFGSLTIAEVLADRRGDMGAVITGMREYAPLAPATRSRLRTERVVAAALLLFSGILPVPALILFIWLGSKGLIGGAAAPFMVMGPSVLVFVASVWLRTREQRGLGRTRALLQQRHVPSEKLARLVDPWYETFESARRDQVLGRGPGGYARTSWLVGGAIGAAVLFSIVLAVPLGVVGVVHSTIWQNSPPRFSRTQEKARIAWAFKSYGVAVDSSITPLKAGRAFYSLIPGDISERRLFPQHPPPRKIETVTDALPENPWGAPSLGVVTTGDTSLIFKAIQGFTADETLYLERLASLPGWEEFDVVAHAAAMDYLSARYVLPFPDSVSLWAMPLPRSVGTKEWAYANSARAALWMSQGKLREAEEAFGETISVGLLLMEEHFLITSLVGAVITGIGRHGLEEFYTATGREREASVLRAKYDSVIGLNEELSVASASQPTSFDVAYVRNSITRVVQDSTMTRGLRWELLRWLPFAPCTNVRELIFGPDRELQVVFSSAREQLARFPSEEQYYDFITAELERSIQTTLPVTKRAVFRAADITGKLLGNKRLGGCVQVLLR